MSKILVLENTLPFGKAIQQVLKDGKRHRVVLAQGLVPNDQQVVAQTHAGRNIPLDLAEFDLVLIDGNAPKGLVASDLVVKRFCEQGVSCVAISALPGANQELVNAGAKLQVRKHVLICGMAAGCMKTAELALASPVVQARLELLDKRVSSDKVFRQQGEDILSRHLQAA
jgi:hypothetical protein